MSKPTSRAALVALALVVAPVLAACAPGPNPLAHHAVPGQPLAGFWLGLWHGIIVVVAFIVSLFDSRVSIYEVHNTGWPYDLGYALGVMLFHGGGGAGARHRWRAQQRAAPPPVDTV